MGYWVSTDAGYGVSFEEEEFETFIHNHFNLEKKARQYLGDEQKYQNMSVDCLMDIAMEDKAEFCCYLFKDSEFHFVYRKNSMTGCFAYCFLLLTNKQMKDVSNILLYIEKLQNYVANELKFDKKVTFLSDGVYH